MDRTLLRPLDFLATLRLPEGPCLFRHIIRWITELIPEKKPLP
jgi:hypothetical protein